MQNRYVRNARVETAPMKDETVLFNPGNKKFCVLNVTAAMIWGILDRPRTVPEIVASVCAQYASADPAKVEQDVRQALNELQEIECIGQA